MPHVAGGGGGAGGVGLVEHNGGIRAKTVYDLGPSEIELLFVVLLRVASSLCASFTGMQPGLCATWLYG